MTYRTDIINSYLKDIDLKKARTKYLEIGVQTGENISRIIASEITGVDKMPKPQDISLNNYTHYQGDSDDFFDIATKDNQRYDVIFIDGDHSYEQSKKDLVNAFKIIDKDGVILMHDANPYDINYMKPEWSGEVYKTVLWAQQYYEVYTHEEDHGVAVIFPSKKRSEIKILDINMDQKEFLNNKRDLLVLKKTEAIKQDALYKTDVPLEDYNDEELKSEYKAIFGKKPRGRFNRENVIQKIKEERYEA